MALAKTLQCPKCERKFAREGHLARHMNTIHGKGGAKTTTKGKRGRPKGSTRKSGSGLSLSQLSIDQLKSVLSDVKQEVGRRVKELKSAFRKM